MTSALARVREHIGRPLERSGYALLLASGISSILGFGFWAIAARRYAAEEVGLATALISTLGFLANLATLGLRSGILRFLPTIGRERATFIHRCYVVCVLTALVVGTVFVLGRDMWWGGEPDLLRDHQYTGVAFVLGVAVWVLFILQNQVCVALGHPGLVPTVSILYGILKIGMLALLSGGLVWAIFFSYTAPAVVGVVVVSIVVFGRLTRKPTVETGLRPPVGVLVRFAAGEHAASLLGMAAVDLLPLLVLARAGSSASAYYYLSFTAAYFLYLVTSSFGSALVVEASRDQQRMALLSRRTIRNAFVIIAPAVALGLVAGPYFLGLLGGGYSDHALLLQLLLLSALPQIVLGVAASVLRVQRRVGLLAAMYGAQAVLVFGGAELGMRMFGLTGVGLAWLGSQCLLAVVLLLTVLQHVWIDTVPAVLLAWIDERRRALRRARRSTKVRRLVAGFDGRLSGSRLLTADNDTLVVAGELDGRPVVVRYALTDAAVRGLHRHADTLEIIAQIDNLGEWRGLVPEIVASRTVPQLGDVIVESRLPGRSALGVEPAQRALVVAQLARAMQRVHDGSRVQVDAEVYLGGLRRRLATFLRLPGSADWHADITALEAALVTSVAQIRPQLNLTHGDCWLGNALVDGDFDPRLCGIVDWENGSSHGLSDVDIGHLWLSAQGLEVGPALQAALSVDCRGFDSAIDKMGVTRMNPALPSDLVLILAWVDHVAGNIERCSARMSGGWARRNVGSVVPTALRAAETWRAKTLEGQ